MESNNKEKEIFVPKKWDDALDYEKIECRFYDGHDDSKFKLLDTICTEKDKYSRFNQKDLNDFLPVNENLRWIGLNSAGLKLRFKTNSRVIKLNVRENGNWEIYNMTFYSQNGFDLYYFDEKSNKWIYHASSTPEYYDKRAYKSTIGRFHNKKVREFILNFPTYTSVEKLEIGLEKNSYIEPVNYPTNEKIVCYGTSIIQGGATSRPGLITTNVLSRLLNKEVINLGFSGNAFLEKVMAEKISQIEDMELLIIDPEANAGYDNRLEDNLNQFIDIIYSKHPDLKIIVSNKTYMALDEIYPLYKRSKKYYDKFLKNVVKNYQKQGKNIYFMDNYSIFENNYFDKSEYTVDGCHPNDLGMTLLTDNYLKNIKKILRG